MGMSMGCSLSLFSLIKEKKQSEICEKCNESDDSLFNGFYVIFCTIFPNTQRGFSSNLDLQCIKA